MAVNENDKRIWDMGPGMYEPPAQCALQVVHGPDHCRDCPKWGTCVAVAECKPEEKTR
jgi:hypothetical protein